MVIDVYVYTQCIYKHTYTDIHFLCDCSGGTDEGFSKAMSSVPVPTWSEI